MVTTKLLGGLGNQMFQIATLYAYAKRHGFEYGLNFDACYTPNQGNAASKYKDNFFKNINKFDTGVFNMTYREPSFSYNEITKNDNVVLDGYFQSEKYFKDYEFDIIRLFLKNFDIKDKHKVLTFLYGIYKESDRRKDNVTVHVRRGDYLKNSEFHTNLADTTDYYQKAMNLFKNANFIFVSDDIQWCKNNFKGDNIYYSPFKSELEDLCLMALAHGNIIANSSFSWWGAYLSLNEKIVAPKQWFGPNGPKDTQDIIPEKWIKI